MAAAQRAGRRAQAATQGARRPVRQSGGLALSARRAQGSGRFYGQPGGFGDAHFDMFERVFDLVDQNQAQIARRQAR